MNLIGHKEIYIIVHNGKEFALDTSSIESIHSFESINFNDDMSRCLPESVLDWDQSVPVIGLMGLLDNESKRTFEKHSSRVIFMSDNQKGITYALIVNIINKVVNADSEIKIVNESDKTYTKDHIQIDNKVIEIFNISNIFMT